MIIPRSLSVPVVQHGIQRHLKCYVHTIGIFLIHAERRGESAARALSAGHNLIPADPQSPRMTAHPQKRRMTIL